MEDVPPFPFEPYPIQKKFMLTLMKTIEDGKIGIFESPTGTGKSLSIICSSLQWLKHHRSREPDLKVQNTTKTGKKLPSWLVKAAEKVKRTKFEEKQGILSKRNRKIESLADKSRKRKRDGIEDGMEHCLSDNDDDNNIKSDEFDEKSYKDSMMLKWDSDSDDDDDGDIEMKNKSKKRKAVYHPDDYIDENWRDKIIFCSRTHSQLAQFLQELKKTEFANDTKSIVLGSRRNLCINKDLIEKSKSDARLNEACLELKQNGKCPYYSQAESKGLAAQMLGSHMDLEDMHRLGSRAGQCPYYASRNALPDSDVAALPYNLLVQKNARQSLGLKLEGSAVILDEAHNFADCVNAAHSCEVSGPSINSR